MQGFDFTNSLLKSGMQQRRDFSPQLAQNKNSLIKKQLKNSIVKGGMRNTLLGSLGQNSPIKNSPGLVEFGMKNRLLENDNSLISAGLKNSLIKKLGKKSRFSFLSTL